MSNFYRDVICKDPRFGLPTRCADVALLEPVLRGKVEAIIEDAADHGLSLMVWETFRSRARQETLYTSGTSQLKRVGVHHYGLACDLVKRVMGNEPSWKGSFALLGQLAKNHGLVWGGDFSFKDYVHVQRCAVKHQASLFRGEWWPEADYLPLAA